MKIVKPSHKLILPMSGHDICKHLEMCGRVCYKSEDKITENSYEKFLKSIIKRGHESVLEHASFTVIFKCDRGISHEIVRHRIASYSQESTRYCNYGNEKFGGEISIIDIPCELFSNASAAQKLMQRGFKICENIYIALLDMGVKPEIARGILPTSLATTLVMTANIREWRHFFKLRTSSAAHPQVRELVIPLLKEVQDQIPILFDDIEVE